MQGSDAGLTERARFPFGASLVHVGKFDTDSYPDVLLSGRGGLALLHGTADGSLEPTWIGSLRRPNAYHQFDSGDLDGDGVVDAVLLGYDSTIETWRGNGDGTLTQSSIAPSAPGSRLLPPLRDIDRDGKQDLVLSGGYANEFAASIGFGLGDGSFESPVARYPIPVSTQISTLRWGDLDADGDDDAVVSAAGYHTPWLQELSYWRTDGRTVTRISQQFDPAMVSPRELGDIDGDGRADLIGIAASSGSALAADPSASFLAWSRTNADGTPSPPEPITIAGAKIDSWNVLLVNDLDGDHNGDLIVNVRDTYPNSRWLSFAGNGSGTFTKIWESISTGDSFNARIADLDGDGFADILDNSYGISYWRGDGAGGFFPSTSYLDPGSERISFGRTRTFSGRARDAQSLAPLDAIGFDSDQLLGGLVVSPQRGRSAERDTSPPEGRLITRPVIDRPTAGLPTFDGTWILGTSALDDCRSARITSRRLDLLSIPGDAPVTYHVAALDEIRIYEFAPTSVREVHLFGPDEAAIRSRFETARNAGGFPLPQNARIRIITADRLGSPAGQNGEPASVIPNVALTQRLILLGDSLIHAEVRRPGGDVTVTLQSIDEQSKAATTVQAFGEARRAYCDSPGAEQIACE
ncbi:MAG: VCBS repeat-containing protein [Acidobacteriota bacterium]